MLARLAHNLGNALVRTRVIEQPAVVDVQKSAYRLRIFRDAGRGERTPDEDLRARADHRPHLVDRQRRRAQLAEQLVDGVGEIARGVDQRAVEIEGDQAAV